MICQLTPRSEIAEKTIVKFRITILLSLLPLLATRALAHEGCVRPGLNRLQGNWSPHLEGVQPEPIRKDERLDILKLLNSGRDPKRLQGPRRADPRPDAYGFLDIEEGLGFSKSVSRGRLVTELKTPLLDASEIRLRQGAVGELLMPERDRLRDLQAIYSSPESRNWRELFYAGNRRETRAPSVFPMTLNEANLPTVLDEPLSVKFAKERMRARLGFLDEVDRLRDTLAGSRSPRLRQLKWVLDAFASKSHPLGIADWVERFRAADDLMVRWQLVQEANRPPLAGSLSLAMEAYGELAMYFDIAQHARDSGWSAFPRILDRVPGKGPTLMIKEGHSPRVHRNPKREKPSVGNSITLDTRTGRALIVTGPNAQGKTTFARMLPQNIVLAQMGSPVPAKSMALTPMDIVAYVHPKDSPADQQSLFMAESHKLWNHVYNQAKNDPHTLVIMDEILPGTITEIREDVETAFLEELDSLGVISVTATHNWGTTSLGIRKPGRFRNVHVDQYALKPGRAEDLDAMYDGAIEALRKSGWPQHLLEKVRLRGEERVRASKAAGR